MGLLFQAPPRHTYLRSPTARAADFRNSEASNKYIIACRSQRCRLGGQVRRSFAAGFVGRGGAISLNSWLPHRPPLQPGRTQRILEGSLHCGTHSVSPRQQHSAQVEHGADSSAMLRISNAGGGRCLGRCERITYNYTSPGMRTRRASAPPARSCVDCSWSRHFVARKAPASTASEAREAAEDIGRLYVLCEILCESLPAIVRPSKSRY